MPDICSLDHLLHRFYKPFDLAICSWPSRRDFSVLQTESLCKGLKSATVEGLYLVFLHRVCCAEFGEDLVNFWDNILAEVDFTVSTTGYQRDTGVIVRDYEKVFAIWKSMLTSDQGAFGKWGHHEWFARVRYMTELFPPSCHEKNCLAAFNIHEQ